MTDSGAGGGLRERKKRATRAALAEAAVRLAAEHGAEHVTVEAISEAAGVSPRTFFNYFDSHDDAFVMIDAEVGTRLRQAVLAAPAERPPLDALRDALAVELAGVEEQHELWDLRAQVLRKSPHLLVRSLGAHMADEFELARAVAQRLAPDAGNAKGAGHAGSTGDAGNAQDAGDAGDTAAAAVGLYPRLAAAVAATAVRVSVEHWSAQGGSAGDTPFLDVFRTAFDHLAAGLPAPPAPHRTHPEDP